jgi:hypothetical protein
MMDGAIAMGQPCFVCGWSHRRDDAGFRAAARWLVHTDCPTSAALPLPPATLAIGRGKRCRVAEGRSALRLGDYLAGWLDRMHLLLEAVVTAAHLFLMGPRSQWPRCATRRRGGGTPCAPPRGGRAPEYRIRLARCRSILLHEHVPGLGLVKSAAAARPMTKMNKSDNARDDGDDDDQSDARIDSQDADRLITRTRSMPIRLVMTKRRRKGLYTRPRATCRPRPGRRSMLKAFAESTASRTGRRPDACPPASSSSLSYSWPHTPLRANLGGDPIGICGSVATCGDRQMGSGLDLGRVK